MAKVLLYFIISFIFSYSVFSQELKESQKKMFISINASLNNTFVENLHREDLILNIKDIKIGGAIGLGIKYNFVDWYYLSINLNILSMESIKYSYYGTSYSSISGYPQIFLTNTFKLTKNPNLNIIMHLGCGLSTTPMNYMDESYYFLTDYGPERKVTEQGKAGVYPLITTGIGLETKLKKGRIVTYNLMFNKGFIPIAKYKFERISSPQLSNSFEYKGSLLAFQVNWYFKRKY